MRAPIFYDSNDTGYYIDAASTSNLNALTTQGALNAGNGNLTPAGTTFSNVITGRGTNRVVAFDGNGTVPSVWWTNGGTAIGAIDAISGGGLAQRHHKYRYPLADILRQQQYFLLLRPSQRLEPQWHVGK
jgi:hypothetical protein